MLNLGNLNVKDLFLGSTKVSSAWLGTQKVWPAWTNPYVTDGLIAMWDGEWNAGPGIHDPAAAVWKNLVNPDAYALSLGLGSWTDNARRHTSYTNASPWCAAYYDGQIPNDVHVEFCCDITSIQGTNQGGTLVYRNRAGSWTPQSACVPVLGSALRITPPTTRWYGASGYTRTTLQEGAWRGKHTWSFKMQGLWLDAEQLALMSGNENNSWSDAKLEFFGRGNQKTYHTYGDIFNVRVYSRALTAEEIAANYAVDKARFGLT